MSANTAFDEFISECEELSEKVSQALSLIESKNYTVETLNDVYRNMHTIKGSAQLFGFAQIAEIAHTMENSLDYLRKGTHSLNTETISALYQCLDVIEKILIGLKISEKEPDHRQDLEKAIPRLEKATHLLTESKTDKPKTIQQIKTVKTEVNTTNSPPNTADDFKINNNSTIRVNTKLLDSLMNLMGEMTLIRNEVLQYSDDLGDLDFSNLSKRLDSITSEIQEDVMKTRMQPLSNIINKFTRVVRDMSQDLGKKIELDITGADTELDKTLLEAIKDPLTHVVRNSVDHGIDTPKERTARGMPETGKITIRAFHQSGQVIIEISDDGKGLNKDKIIKTALAKQLVSNKILEEMSEFQIHNLIFLPGFTTTNKITNISGRGVGMDVVKTNIERIGGTVEIESLHGTTVRFKLPLTLAIVPVLIVKINGSRFCLPQNKTLELVKANISKGFAKNSSDFSKIEYLQGQPVFRLRDKLLTLVDLREVLNVNRTKIDEEEVNIVVMDADGESFGLIVDEVLDTSDIVVKSLDGFLKKIDLYSGATIMSNGDVALILDVAGIARHANICKNNNSYTTNQNKNNLASVAEQNNTDYLLVDIGKKSKYSIPLKEVCRLEVFKSRSIELSGEKEVIQYGEQLLSLLSLSNYLGFDNSNDQRPDELNIVVIRRDNNLFGIEVNNILDVISYSGQIDGSVRDRKGILGNFIANGELVVVADIDSIIENETDLRDVI